MLIITDLHLTDNAADEYRWAIFNWVASWYEDTKERQLLILGDLTDSKDHHSAALVYRMIWNLQYLTNTGMEIFILKGNHDYIDPNMPFFGFLTLFKDIHYISDPEVKVINGNPCLFLPHTRNPIDDWKHNRTVQENLKSAKFVFMHQSVIGSVTSNGYEMQEGLPPSYFKRFKGQVISGDIHVPQTIGPVTYVGAPYSVRFNDHYEPRALEISEALYKGNPIINSHSPNIPGRWTLDITSADEIDAPSGFQVKVRVHLDDIRDWPMYKKEVEERCKELGLILSSIQLVGSGRLPLRRKVKADEESDPGIIVYNYGKRRSLTPASIRTGRKIVESDDS